jgi:hypothetical protein
MKTVAIIAIACALANAAIAGTIDGRDAVIVASLIAQQSPKVAAADKRALAGRLPHKSNSPSPPLPNVTVKADAISCKMSRYNANEFSCELAFDAQIVKTQSRTASELYDALPSEIASGAMGEYFKELTNLSCSIDGANFGNEAKGGVQCTYDPAEQPLRK